MEEIVITPEEKAEDQKHIDEMVKRVDGTPIPETPPEGKLFAGKYKSVEELEKGYSELQKKLGAPKDEAPPENKDEGKPPTGDPVENKDFQPFFDEFSKDGKLSDDSYKALAAKGLSKAVVDEYIEGQQARVKLSESEAQKTQNEIFEIVGGAERYTDEIAWAAKNLSKEDIEAYNQAVIGTPAQAKLAVTGLHAKFAAANKEANLVLGDGSGVANSDVYTSRAQMTKDMNSELYRKDPAERARVKDKLGRSKIM